MKRTSGRRLGAALRLVLLWACAAVATPASPSALAAHLAALEATLDPRAAAALRAMPDPDRRLLAARAYLRAGSSLAQRWSWSEAEAQLFNAGAGKVALEEAIARVNCAFTAANPGHELYVNPRFRSLDVQLRNWNRNGSVGRAARSLGARAAVAARGMPEPGTSAGAQALRRWLMAAPVEPPASLAAPGLSPHGQMRAVDFQVRHRGRIIAPASTSAVEEQWDRAGWAARLAAAVDDAGQAFLGPLESPREPWHYDFEPERHPLTARGSVPPAQCSPPAAHPG